MTVLLKPLSRRLNEPALRAIRLSASAFLAIIAPVFTRTPEEIPFLLAGILFGISRPPGINPSHDLNKLRARLWFCAAKLSPKQSRGVPPRRGPVCLNFPPRPNFLQNNPTSCPENMEN